MEVVSEKARYNNNGQDKKGKKNTKVELNLGKNGGFFILLGGALVTALLSSAFRKNRKSREKDKNHLGNTPPAAATEEAGDEPMNNISNGEDPAGDDEDPVRKGVQFILSDPSSLIPDHLSKEMDETIEKDGSILKMQAIEEQDSHANGCHQEIISNDSSIPGSATSSEQEYSSQPFYTNPLFEQANLLKEEGDLHTEDFRVAKADETIMETSLGEEAKEMADVLPDETEQMEYSEKNFSPEIEMDLCDGQKLRNDENRGVGDIIDDDQNSTNFEENGNTNEAASGNDEEETKQYIQFVDEKKLCEDDIATVKQNHILPSNDKEGDETDDGDGCDYGDGDDDISEESSEGGGISSDEVAIWPAEPVETALMELKEPNLKEETDYINFKTSNTSKHQNSPRKLVFLDNLVTFSLQSKRRILAGTFTLLIAYSCFWYFELPFLKPSLVVIAAMFLSKVVVLAV